MRNVVGWLVCVALLAGCSTGKWFHWPSKPAEPAKPAVVTQSAVVIGRVISVKQELQFAVLNFPVGTLPGKDSHLNVYRQGVKVGEVKVTGPQQEDNIVVDIITGQLQPGDEVRED